MTTQQPDRLITVHDLEHPRSVTRSIKAGLTLAGVAAAGVFALAATSPAANADTVDLPDLPSLTGEPINPESLGVAPLFTALAEQYNGSYTDSLGVSVNTTAPFTPEPLQVDAYGFNGINPTFIAETIHGPRWGCRRHRGRLGRRHRGGVHVQLNLHDLGARQLL